MVPSTSIGNNGIFVQNVDKTGNGSVPTEMTLTAHINVLIGHTAAIEDLAISTILPEDTILTNNETTISTPIVPGITADRHTPHLAQCYMLLPAKVADGIASLSETFGAEDTREHDLVLPLAVPVPTLQYTNQQGQAGGVPCSHPYSTALPTRLH